MPIIRFRGRVLPRAYAIHEAPMTLRWPEPDGSGHMRFDVHIADSVAEVACYVANYTPSDIGLPHIRALELARSIVNSAVFVNGTGLTLIFEELIGPDGEVRLILPANSRLPPLCTAFSGARDAPPERTLEAMARLVIQDPSLFVALNELIVAITVPGQVAVNCGKAIEGLRKIMVPVDPTRKLGWAALQSSLNIDRSYRELITDTSTGPRHGDRADIPINTSQMVLERSWVIMNRFLEYRKRGNQALPISEFPLLS